MITLKTLPQATAQQVFDQVVNHLLTQKEKSDHSGACYYRSERDGKKLMCAAGCLIGDDEYKIEMDRPMGKDGTGWFSIAAKYCIPLIHGDLIYALQLIHDGEMVENWEQLLKELAVREKLQFNPPVAA